MIFFKPKPVPATPAPTAPPAAVEGPERIDDAAIARRKKADSDGTLRRLPDPYGRDAQMFDSSFGWRFTSSRYQRSKLAPPTTSAGTCWS